MTDTRRFARAWAIASAIACGGFAWMITAATGNLFRHQRLHGDFYEAQARSLLRGKLAIAPDVLGIEAFAHDGNTYTYFPPLPALLRIPVMPLTESLDGRLSGAFMVVAFTLAMAGMGTLTWRVRGLVRGDDPLGRGEIWATGAFGVVIGLGTPLLFMASRAWVYHESALWALAFAVCAYDQVVALLIKPTRARLARAATFGGASLLSRAPIGAGALLALTVVLIVALTIRRLPSARPRLRWLALPDALVDEPRWRLRLAIGITIPAVMYAAINYAKFETLFSVPYGAQVQNAFDEQRQRALAANGGSLFNLTAIPTHALQLIRPDAIALRGTFPFVGFPARPPSIVGDVVFDNLDSTTSITATMPLLVILSAIGAYVVARRSRLGPLRIPVITAIVVLPVTFSIVYVAQRYAGDVLPPLLLLSVAGFWTGLRALSARSLAVRRVTLGGFGVVALIGCWTGMALALEYQRVLVPFVPAAERRQYADWQFDAARTFGATAPEVRQGTRLPAPGARGELFILGDCDGLYVSDGTQWAGVERTGATGYFRLRITFPDGQAGTVQPIVTSGSGDDERTLSIRYLPAGEGVFVYGAAESPGRRFSLDPGRAHEYTITIDRRVGGLEVTRNGQLLIGAGDDALADDFTIGTRLDAKRGPAGKIVRLATPPTLCRALLPRADRAARFPSSAADSARRSG